MLGRERDAAAVGASVATMACLFYCTEMNMLD